jgi:phosphoglycolate phosphatase
VLQNTGPPERHLKALLFDLDGTVTDPKEGITRCIAHALEKMGVKAPPLGELTFAIGPPLRPSLARLIGSNDRDDVEVALAAYRERFAAVGLFENAVYEGIPAALAELRRRGHALYLATSKPRVYAERILAHFDLTSCFSGIYGCELDGRMEGKDEIIGHILAAHQIKSDDAVMIGDRSHDVLGARANHVAALGVTWGYGTRDELTQAGALALCDKPAELPGLASLR